MALSPQSNDAFLREVDEELRKDQALHIWQNYGRWIIVAVIAALVAFGGFLYWQSHNEGQRAAEGDKYAAVFKALGENKPQLAETSLKELAGSGTAGFSASARFTQATLLLQKNDLKGAAALMGAIAADTNVPQEFRDLALIRQTMIEYDTMKSDAVVARLRPLAVKDSPWYGSAGEMLAGAYLRQGKRADAGKLYGEIAKDEGVPRSIRQRAVQMAGVLGVDAIVDEGEDKKAQ
ncbi:tetratricopeptide repeat protein [Sphingomonas sp. R647]|uniref:tetratricopeptide repeat protein n=1 Tax=Sphingomonas sp. R647 TaxID=2875233 RepID=UPI001CD3DD4A|nr:tetratricopeptide repeat protein [Sphingomonas sp. R647]MCA1196584.1 tetratricopeptide repeat protein [Sphingomonas sp. R647]